MRHPWPAFISSIIFVVLLTYPAATSCSSAPSAQLFASPCSSDPTWTQTTQSDFLQGTLENVIATADGNLQLDNNELAVDENTVGLWHFNENGGTTAYDNSQKNNNGTLVGNGPRWTTGKFDNGLRFENTGDAEYVKIPYSSSLVTGENFFIELWVKPAITYQPDMPDKWYYFARQDNSTGGGSCWEIGYQGWGNEVEFKVYNSSYENYMAKYPMTLYADNWYHVAGVKKGSEIKLYLNGTLVDTESFSGSLMAPGDLYVSWRSIESWADTFSGVIDEVRLENRAPSGTENYLIYNDGGLRPGTTCHTWGDVPYDNYTIDNTSETPPEGAKYISVYKTTTENGWGGWGIEYSSGSKDLSNYSGGYLNFWIKTPENLLVGVSDTTDDRTVWISNYGWDGTNTWQHLSIPINDLGADLGHIDYPFLTKTDGTSGTFTYHVDQVVWAPSDNCASNEIAGHYENNQELSYDADTIGLWHFNEGADNYVGDSSSRGNHGTTTEDPHWKGGKFRSGIRFNGNGYVRVENNASLNPTQEITVEAWAYFVEQPALNTSQVIVSKNSREEGDVRGYILKTVGEGGNTVALWRFNEGSGTSVADSSPNNNNGTIYGSVSWTGGKYNTALYFPGTSGSYVSVPHSISLAPSEGLSELTVAAWLYMDKKPQTSVFIGKDYVWGSRGWLMKVETAGDANKFKLTVILYSTGGGTYGVTIDNAAPLAQWTHLAFAYKGSTGTIRVYVNGIDRTAEDTWGWRGGTGNVKTSTENLFIGCENATTNWFRGKIDEVRIENRALTADEIAAIVSPPVQVGTWDSTYDNYYRGENENTAYGENIKLAGFYWEDLPDTPELGGAGCSVAYAENGGIKYIYVLRGANTTAFWRYRIDTNTWETMAPTPAAVGGYGGGALVYAENGGIKYLYAFRGGTTDNFWRYRIADDAWETMTSAPKTVTGGSWLAWTGGDNIYATPGNTNEFWRYIISTNTWDNTGLPSLPATSPSGSLVVTFENATDNYLFFARTNTLWRFAVGTNTWVTMASPPNGVSGDVGSMVRVDNIIYLVLGANTTDFYRYLITTNTWENISAKAALPATIAGWYLGNRIAYCDNYLYMVRAYGTKSFWRFPLSSSCSLESSVFDTGQVATWGTISWSATTPTSTSVKVYTRTGADNNPYDGGWSDWAQQDNNTTITSPDNRYIQYKVELSTTDPMLTPTFHEIRINYNNEAWIQTDWKGGPALILETGYNFKIVWGIGTTGSEGGIWVSYQTTFQQGWHHLAGTADGYGATLYVNGENVAWSGYAGSLNWSDNDLTVGCEAHSLQNFFKGIIDEVRIENRALSRAEIKNHAKNYKPSGMFTSVIKDAGETVTWDTIEFDNTTPSGTSLVVRTRSSSDGSSWSEWLQAENGENLPWENRYLQYRVEFTGGDDTPVFSEMRINYSSIAAVVDVEINKLPKWSSLPKGAMDRIADPDNGNPMQIIIKSTTTVRTKAQVKGDPLEKKTGVYDYIGIDNVGMNNGTTSYRDNGTIYGSVSWTTGKLDSCLSFPGTSGSYVSVPHSNELAPSGGLPNLSVEMWVYPESFSSGQPRLLVKRNNSWPPNNGWDIYLENTGATENLDLVVVIKPATTAYWGVKAEDNITPNAWNHVVVTYNGSSAQIKIYVNGTERSYSSWASSPAGNIVSDTENALYIGRDITGISNRYFKGKIDEIRLENRVLTAAEVQDHYNSGAGKKLWVDDSTLAVWHFDEGTGSTCYDGGPVIKLSTSYQDIPWLDNIAVPGGSDNTQNVYLFIRTRSDQMGGTYNGTIYVNLVSLE